ncbi:MAG TPA: hypothetical protein VEV44_10340 [Pseudoneobacillus sp.]|nr:hypothetical protein [Pseudoneobacillus sp.]
MLMVTFRPVKNWLIPLLAIMIGSFVGFSFLPSHQEFDYHQWIQRLNEFEQKSYQFETNFVKDDTNVFESRGLWSSKHSQLSIKTPVSDGSSFNFNVYLEKKQFFIFSGNEWKVGEYPHRFMEELSPLDNPFNWSKELLKNAYKITRIKHGEQETFKAFFHLLPEIELNGILLKKQKESSLTMVLEKGEIQSIIFEATPLRPKEVPFLNSYPEKLNYHMDFTLYNGIFPQLPKEAYLGEPID